MGNSETNNSLGLNTLTNLELPKIGSELEEVLVRTGKTAGRGHKGQKSRSGGSIYISRRTNALAAKDSQVWLFVKSY